MQTFNEIPLYGFLTKKFIYITTSELETQMRLRFHDEKLKVTYEEEQVVKKIMIDGLTSYESIKDKIVTIKTQNKNLFIANQLKATKSDDNKFYLFKFTIDPNNGKAKGLLDLCIKQNNHNVNIPLYDFISMEQTAKSNFKKSLNIIYQKLLSQFNDDFTTNSSKNNLKQELIKIYNNPNTPIAILLKVTEALYATQFLKEHINQELKDNKEYKTALMLMTRLEYFIDSLKDLTSLSKQVMVGLTVLIGIAVLCTILYFCLPAILTAIASLSIAMAAEITGMVIGFIVLLSVAMITSAAIPEMFKIHSNNSDNGYDLTEPLDSYYQSIKESFMPFFKPITNERIEQVQNELPKFEGVY